MGCRSGETPLELGEHFGSWLRAVPRHCLLSGQHREHHQQSGDDWDSHRNGDSGHGDSDDSVPPKKYRFMSLNANLKNIMMVVLSML